MSVSTKQSPIPAIFLGLVISSVATAQKPHTPRPDGISGPGKPVPAGWTYESPSEGRRPGGKGTVVKEGSSVS